MSSLDSLNNNNDQEIGHAFLSPSKYHWVNWDDNKLLDSYSKYRAAAHGTEIHELAQRLIRTRIYLPRTKEALNRYVNDALSFRMSPEVFIYYSKYVFGTADSLVYEPNTSTLRIFDLKTGVSQGSVVQVELYAAIYALQYNLDLTKTKLDLRIYHSDKVFRARPTKNRLVYLISKIKRFSDILSSMEQSL